MATRFSPNLIEDVTSDPRFRALAQFIEDTLVSTGGWAVTTDTGQTLPSALVHPTGSAQKMGYRIYTMTDPLQSTFPVFMKLEFGSASTTNFGVWITIGTGSNGSGTITGILFNGGASGQATLNGGTSTTSGISQLINLSYGSASSNRFSICMCSNPTAGAWTLIFTLERTKDALGNDTGDGLLLIWKTGAAGAGAMDQTVYIKNVPGGPQPLIENGLSYILSSKNPSQMFYPGDIGVGIVIHISAIAQQPGVNMLITNSGDVAIDAKIQLTLYSNIRTYVQCGVIPPRRAITFVGGASPVDTNARILMRYD